MIKHFFSPSPLWQQSGLTLIRIIVGLFITYHGLEVFDRQKMVDYAKWLTDLHFPSPVLMAYLGKGMEFVAGFLLLLGFLTRLAIIALIGTMLIITFGMGKGKIFMEDQHPFLFVLLFLVIFFTGPGKFSLDYILFKKRTASVIQTD
ncbi:MAG: DoxX family protein [Chitinophagaceae bacterium]|nr:DoxX family protein [Chitinophagaceae bacterium]